MFPAGQALKNSGRNFSFTPKHLKVCKFMMCLAIYHENGRVAFRAMEEGPPRTLTDKVRKPLTGAVCRKDMVLNE